MPLVSELPITQTARTSHGWAYVPDTGHPIAAMAASTRKRGIPRNADNKNFYNHSPQKQQKATLQRLERLDEDNWSKQIIPLPARSRSKKSTQNARRILGSERQFKHWHDEYVAHLALGGASISQPPMSPLTGSRRASATQQLPMHPPPRPSLPRIKPEAGIPPSSAPITSVEEQEVVDPLLVARGIPRMPSKRLMDTLLAEPPLSWDTAAAKPLDNRLPVRHFCIVCGYWGKVRCKRCGERTCGLMECWKGHEVTCAVPAY